jgi:CDP-paratose 2-epimerase
MRTLITGGAGFVGSNLAIALKNRFPDAEIVCMDNLYRRGSELNLPRLKKNGVLFHHGDVREPNAFPSSPFDFLIECSAEPSVLAGIGNSPDYLIHTNLAGAYYCLEKARLWSSRFLFLSTSRVYPILRMESHPWKEEPTRFTWKDEGTTGITSKGVAENIDMSGARSLYGYTKYAAELLIEEYRAAFGLRAIINRCGVLTGPWQFGKADQGVAALWVLSHHFGKKLSYIGYGGRGKQVRDFLHIHDLCDLVIEQLSDFDRWDGWIGNVAGGPSNSGSLCELTLLCQEITGKMLEIDSGDTNRPGDLRVFIGNCERLFERTSWRPKRGLRKIVEDISEWVSSEAEALKTI